MSKIVSPKDFDWKWFRQNLKRLPRSCGNPGGQKNAYFSMITAFDIETTRIKEIEQSVMYVWQWQFGLEYTVIGRTWKEFIDFCRYIRLVTKERAFLVVYVHNLSYEFEFLSGIYDFQPDEVFALDSRKVAKCTMLNSVEFRCSYIHSNMNLDMFLKSTKVEHKKQSGERFNYHKQRYSWTPLTPEEIKYCQHDVLGLVEGIMNELLWDQDNVYTIPMTSTGYPRRDAKHVLKEESQQWLHSIQPNEDLYDIFREGFRGGDTHANRYYVGRRLELGRSSDRSSSYPAEMCNSPYPMGKWFHAGSVSMDECLKLMTKREKAFIARFRIHNLRLKDPYWGFPYVPKSKCRGLPKGAVIDNGRVISIPEDTFFEFTMTDVDLMIMLWEYDFEADILDLWHSSYEKLPQHYIRLVQKYFTTKTKLKGVEDMEYFYGKDKAKLNALYGMCAQDPLVISMIFGYKEDDTPEEERIKTFYESTVDKEGALEKAARKNFLPYQVGVWCTAWARYALHCGLHAVYDQGGEPFYCDTDSVKYLGDPNKDYFKDYNVEVQRLSKESGAYADDPKGKTHYMGVFEDEGTYQEFCTLGAKKYVYRDMPKIKEVNGRLYKFNGKLHCTIAGVNKKEGAKELVLHGGVSAFKEGFVFRAGGGLEAVYNDLKEPIKYRVDFHDILITSNVVLRESTYTLGLTAEYKRLLQTLRLEPKSI